MNRRDFEWLEQLIKRKQEMLLKLPAPEILETQAVREVDDTLSEARREQMLTHFDERTIALLRNVMILSWQRGAAYVVERIGAIGA